MIGYGWRTVLAVGHLPGRDFTYSFDCDVRSEPEAFAMHRADEPLLLAVIADRPARGLDPRSDCGVGNEAPAPDIFDDLVPADEPVGIACQQD